MGVKGECEVCDAYSFFPGSRKIECYAIVLTIITFYTIVFNITLASTFEGDRVWWRAGSGKAEDHGEDAGQGQSFHCCAQGRGSDKEEVRTAGIQQGEGQQAGRSGDSPGS